MRIFLIILALALAASAALALWAFIKRSRKGTPGSFGRRSNVTAGLILAAVLGLLAWVAWPSSAGAGNDDDSDDNNVKELTINVSDFNACSEGVQSDEPLFFVRGSDVTHKHSVMPPLPENDPDGVIEAIFGPRGYACLDPSVAVEVAQVQEGMIKFLEREDVKDINEWVSYLVSNPKAWEDVVDEAVKRFEGITWDPTWTPEDGDATFMISDANMGEQYPKLVQREEGVPASGFPAYRFLGYMGDQALLKDLALIQETGWLALPEGKFNQVTEIDLLEEPLVTPETTTTTSPQDEQTEQQDQQADTKDGGGTNQNNQSNANDGGGGNATDGGKNSGDSGGKGGGSGSGCGDSGCGTGGGSGGSGSGGGSGGCGSNCPGAGGGSQPPPATHVPPTRPPAPPTTHRPPPTSPPPTSPPPTAPPTTRPPPPPTTSPPPTVPPTTKKPPTTTTTIPCPPWAC